MVGGDFIPRRCGTVHSETLKDEECVYEWTSQRVHALNGAPAQVWRLCDGSSTVEQIAGRLRAQFGDRADDVVTLAVSEFIEAGILERDLSENVPALSRRDLVKRLGLTAAMVPIVSSIAAPSALEAASGNSQTFNFTGASQTFIVPAGVVQVTVNAVGGAGGLSFANSIGRAASVVTTLAVTPGESLTITVGGVGGNSVPPTPTGLGGFNGGGNGNNSGFASGGGGASDVRRGGTKLVIAGGGGGSGGGVGDSGGFGGLPDGSSGGGGPVSGGGTQGGAGGTQIAGGAGGGAAPGGSPGAAGVSGTGGNGVGAFCGGGGGGGYFGGGGGGGGGGLTTQGGGGGGSSYSSGTGTSYSLAPTSSTNGSVTISW